MTLSRIQWPDDLIARYNVNGPRYTSYPTALSFVKWTAEDAINTWRDTDPGAPLSLYVHIPFCRHLCYYCACNKVVTRDQKRADGYLDALEREMSTLRQWVGQRPVRQLHWGGGTPTFLSDQQSERLCQLLSDYFNLERTNRRREFSLEVDPRVTSVERLQRLYDWGFNRLSLGVQDFNPETQAAVHRIQPFAEVAALINSARQTGYKSISVDLIYGLPLQTQARFHRTLEQIISLRPDRIACYNYAHLPTRFSPQKRINSADLPDPASKLAIQHDTIDTLQEAGYRYIGMDHFALPSDDLSRAYEDGTLQRNFQGYSTHGNTELLGLGVSAISQLGGAFLQNHKDLADYQAATESGSAVAQGYKVTRDDLIRHHMIMGLACHGRVNLRETEQRFDISARLYFAAEWPRLTQLATDGLIELDERFIRVTPTGRLLLRAICMVFDAHLTKTDKARYSRIM